MGVWTYDKSSNLAGVGSHSTVEHQVPKPKRIHPQGQSPRPIRAQKPGSPDGSHETEGVPVSSLALRTRLTLDLG